jgi:hypothetical protein
MTKQHLLVSGECCLPIFHDGTSCVAWLICMGMLCSLCAADAVLEDVLLC